MPSMGVQPLQPHVVSKWQRITTSNPGNCVLSLYPYKLVPGFSRAWLLADTVWQIWWIPDQRCYTWQTHFFFLTTIAKNPFWKRNSRCSAQSRLARPPAHDQVLCTQLPLAQNVSVAYGLEVSERRPWHWSWILMGNEGKASHLIRPSSAPRPCLYGPHSSCNFSPLHLS